MSLLLPILALTLSGCSLYELNDDTGQVTAECPTGEVLDVTDFPCTCEGTLVNSVDADDCVCVAGEGLDCLSEFDTGLPSAH